MKQLRNLIVLIALFSVVLVACQSEEVEATPVAEEPGETQPEVVEVTRIVEAPAGGELVTLVARCKAAPPSEEGRCNNLLAAVVRANERLAEAGDSRRIQVDTIQDNKDWGDYKTEFELASEAGQAPDIIVSGHEHIGDWVPAGYLVPITDMIPNYPEFEDVIDSLWASAELNGEIYGVPQAVEARPMFYSKPRLRELGWSEEEIESLPERVRNGEFTWEEMFDTAEQAIEAGVVEPGNGWWHRPSNGPDFLYYYFAAGGEIIGAGDALLFDRDAALTVYQMLYSATQERNIHSTTQLDGDWTRWHTGASSGDVMFVYGGIWNWAEWYNGYVADRGGEDFLWETFGFSLIPGMEAGTGEPLTLTHPLLYMVSSGSEHPDLALQLIATATTKELHTNYAIASGNVGILKSQADYEPFTSAEFSSAVLYMLDYTTFLPNSPFWSTWSESYYLGIQAVESGDLTPDEALEVVVEKLQNELGDNVVIR